jgi:enolase
MGFRIKKIHAREILDSRGNPTIEVEVTVGSITSRSSVPSGVSKGRFETIELRDGGNRYHGMGVKKAVKNVNEIISKKIVGMDVMNQKEIDETLIDLDGTENKSRLGANAILGVSLSVLKASALCMKIPLWRRAEQIAEVRGMHIPIPQMNVINGGKHAGIEEDIQEHMIMPVKFKTFKDALRAGVETYHCLKEILYKKFGAAGVSVGDEGGFTPPIKNTEQRLEIIEKAIEGAGYKKKIFFALDCASSEFFKNGIYRLEGKKYTNSDLIDYYEDLIKKFPIISIEDGLAENDWIGWCFLTRELGSKVQIVGDDLLVTNVKRIEEALEKRACNALLLKMNQIGTVTESINAARLAHENKWNVIVSHRSGETVDTCIADIAVGLSPLGINQVKFGAPARGERTEKYNQLLRIEEAEGIKYSGLFLK